VRIIQLN